MGRLEREKTAILYLKSRLWTQTFMNVSIHCCFYDICLPLNNMGSNLTFSFLSFPSQKENQNHSYSLKSSASFSVIEFPYKNLSFPEDVHNSTIVSYLIFKISVTQGNTIKLKRVVKMKHASDLLPMFLLSYIKSWIVGLIQFYRMLLKLLIKF